MTEETTTDAKALGLLDGVADKIADLLTIQADEKLEEILTVVKQHDAKLDELIELVKVSQ